MLKTEKRRERWRVDILSWKTNSHNSNNHWCKLEQTCMFDANEVKPAVHPKEHLTYSGISSHISMILGPTCLLKFAGSVRWASSPVGGWRHGGWAIKGGFTHIALKITERLRPGGRWGWGRRGADRTRSPNLNVYEAWDGGWRGNWQREKKEFWEKERK